MQFTRRERWTALFTAEGFSWFGQLIVFLLAALIIFSRRPDVVLHAQFYAEDGAVWFSDAYNLGWLNSLKIPAGGYLNTLQRLVAGVALLLPFRDAPLVMNLFGIAIQAAPAWFLLTRRCAAWGSLPARIGLAALYLAIPNSREVHVVLTNSQFHFALLAFLVATAAPPDGWSWKTFDLSVLLINGLSGPFGIVLLPLVLVYWWRRRQIWSLIVAAIVVPTVAVQLAELAFGGLAVRSAGGQLGATPMLFAQILAGQVYVASFLGENNFAAHPNPWTVIPVLAAGSALLGYCFLKGPLQLKLFILFAFALFAASLSHPLIATGNQWQVLTTIRSMRYWFFPMLAFLWCLLWCFTQRSERLQMFGFLALLSAIIGIHRDWRYAPYKDEHFEQYVTAFDAAPAGTVVTIPIFPDGVTVQLKKH